jgi:hypothetical protein
VSKPDYIIGKRPFPAACLKHVGWKPLAGVEIVWENPRIFTLRGERAEYIVAYRRLLLAMDRMRRAEAMSNSGMAAPSATKSSPESGAAVTDHKENFPRPMASSRTGKSLQNSPCNRLRAPPDLGQI